MDRYSNFILTLIAIALWGLLLRPIFAPGNIRASDIQDVNIAQIDGTRPAYIDPIPVECIGR